MDHPGQTQTWEQTWDRTGGLPDWSALTGPDHRTRRGRAVVAAAAVPWLVLALVLLRPGLLPRGRGGEAGADAPTAAGPATPAAPATPPAPAAAAGPQRRDTRLRPPADQAVRFGARVSVGAGEAAAVAIAVARAWLNDVGPNLETAIGKAATGAYVDQLSVEEVDHPGPGAVVVTVVAILLDAEKDVYRRARVVRLAVPVRTDAGGARPAGAPWWLPAPDLTPDPPPDWTPVEDAAALVAAGEALTDAGYRQVAVRSLERGPFWALRVTADAIAPGTDASSAHQLWLREHLGRLLVAGWRPNPDPPAEVPPRPPLPAAPSPAGPSPSVPSGGAPSPTPRRSSR